MKSNPNLNTCTITLLTLLMLTTTEGELAEGENSNVAVLDEVLVESPTLYTDQINALKTPTPIIDVPQSLSILTAEQFQEQGFSSIGDVVNYTPGVTTSQGEGHRDAVVIRGVRTTADFFIDGVRDDVQYYRPLYNIQQIEILRGPNALFFGRGGTGGIVNRVKKKGDLSEIFTDYSFAIDTFGASEIQVDSNYVINEYAAARLNAFYEGLENHRDFYDGDRYGVNPTVRIEPTDTTILDLSYEYANHERFIDRGIPTGANGRPVEAFEDIVFADPALNNSDLEAHLIRATLQQTISDNLKGNVTAFYGDYEKSYSNFYVSGYDQVNTPDEVTLDGYVDNTDRQNFTLSSNLIGEFETFDIGHTIIIGGEYINTQSDQDRFNADWDPNPTVNEDEETFLVSRPLSLNGGVGVNADGDPVENNFTQDRNDSTQSDINVFSIYIQDEIEIMEQLDLILGVRFDRFDIEVFDAESGNRGSQIDEEFSPRLGLVYKPIENISTYVSYSMTFLPQSGEQFANLGDAGLDPDEFTNLEGGIKWDIKPDLSVTAAVFHIQQDTFEAPDDGGFNQVRLESEVYGFETQIQGSITKQWFLSAGYSYLNGEIESQDSAENGNRPRELPEHMFSMWNRYQITQEFGVGLGFIYQGESYVNNSNTAELPDYIRIDAAAYYEISENLRVQVNIENLTDELYFPNAHSTHQVTVGAPINARFAISGRF